MYLNVQSLIAYQILTTKPNYMHSSKKKKKKPNYMRDIVSLQIDVLLFPSSSTWP